MPWGPNAAFVGRDSDLLHLATVLKGEPAASLVPTAVVTGMGGLGKTRLAVEFAHRYGSFFAGGVFWLNFADPTTVPAQIAGFANAEALNLPPWVRNIGPNEQAERVLAAWQSHVPRLVVFDNCEEPALLRRWRPTTGGCRVLVTSRRAIWNVSLNVELLQLGGLSRTDSVELLRKFLPGLAADDPVLSDIAVELGDLPLALRLAGSVLQNYRHALTPSAYLETLRGAVMLDSLSPSHGDFSFTGHDQNVARSFALSYDRLQIDDARDSMARALLTRAANFAPPAPIPRRVLLATLEPESNDLEQTLRAEDALLRLLELGLLDQEEEGSVRLHRLLAAFVRNTVLDEQAMPAVERILLAVTKQQNSAGNPRPLLPLQPHLRAVTDTAAKREDERAVALCLAFGYHLSEIAAYAEAKPYYQRALAIREKVRGRDHPETAVCLNELAGLLFNQGAHAEARAYYERALAIREKALGPDDPDTANSLHNLGYLLRERGDYVAARPYLERALAICEKVLGPNHPNTANSASNLGLLFHYQGVYGGARAYYEQALAIREKALGSDHPVTAFSLNNLGMLFHEQGNYAEARPYLEHALAIRKESLGADHPDTALSLNNLGALFRDEGLYAEAKSYLETALASYQRVLGPDHPDTANSLCDMGLLLWEQGNYAEARPFLERALAIRKETLGANHHDTARSLNHLGSLLERQGEYTKAHDCFGQALAICETTLGTGHPLTQTVRGSLFRIERTNNRE